MMAKDDYSKEIYFGLRLKLWKDSHANGKQNIVFQI